MELKQFRIPPQSPPKFTGTPTSIVGDTKKLIERVRAVEKEIVDNVKSDQATFNNVLLPLAHAENAMHVESDVLSLYASVSEDPHLRDASRKSSMLMSDFCAETNGREGLFRLVDAVWQKGDVMNSESFLLLKQRHNRFIHFGMGLPAGTDRDRLQAIRKQIARNMSDFEKNQMENDGGLWFTPHELVGLSNRVLSMLEKGSGENEGKLRATFRKPIPFYSISHNVQNSETRRKWRFAVDNSFGNNATLFRETVLLRDEAAHLLGYKNHALLRMEERVAKKTETVNEFLHDLRCRLETAGLTELQQLKKIKKADLESRGETFDDRFYIWDYHYYVTCLVEKLEKPKNLFDFAEYFPLRTTVPRILDFFGHLFGVAFDELTNSNQDTLSDTGNGSDFVWHEDVQLYSVWNTEDEGATFLGYLYLDLFSREGKLGGIFNTLIQPGFTREDGTRQHPSTGLICNFAIPERQNEKLLNHREIISFTHELGHAMHNLVSKTDFWNFHGTNVSVDFGEGPGQFLEKWCWIPSILKVLGRHYSYLSPEHFLSWKEEAGEKSQPPEQIPDETIEHQLQEKDMCPALFLLNLLQFSFFDMLVHQPQSHEDLESMNISAEWNKLRKELTKFDGPETLGYGFDWGSGQADFGHVMSDYDVGYYSYLFSQSLFDDIFHTSFVGNPTDSKQGRRYRHGILEKGGSQDEMQTVVDYLGRTPVKEPFYKELRLA